MLIPMLALLNISLPTIDFGEMNGNSLTLFKNLQGKYLIILIKFTESPRVGQL